MYLMIYVYVIESLLPSDAVLKRLITSAIAFSSDHGKAEFGTASKCAMHLEYSR